VAQGSFALLCPCPASVELLKENTPARAYFASVIKNALKITANRKAQTESAF
jgi:hypothetical protein